MRLLLISPKSRLVPQKKSLEAPRRCSHGGFPDLIAVAQAWSYCFVEIWLTSVIWTAAAADAELICTPPGTAFQVAASVHAAAVRGPLKTQN